MEIRIELTVLDPPVGVLRVVIEDETGRNRADRPVIEFSGWLGLLHALYQATGSTNQPGTGGSRAEIGGGWVAPE